MSASQLTLTQVAQALKLPERALQKAVKESLKVERIMFTTEDIEKLKAYLSETDAHSGSRRGNPVHGARHRDSVKSSRTGVVIERRKDRGHKVQKPVEEPVKQQTSDKEEGVSAKPQRSAPVVVSAPSKAETELRKQETQMIDQIYERNLLSKPAAEQSAIDDSKDKDTKLAAEPELQTKETPKPAGDGVNLRPVGTISIDKGTFDKRIRKQRRRAARNKPRRQEFVQPVTRKSFMVDVPETIPIKELAYRMSVKTSAINEIILAVDDSIEEVPAEIDQEFACLIVEELGHTAVKVYENQEATFITQSRTSKGENIVIRPPVVTIMGHVDHGKTSLLDYIRKTKVTDSESGGITQHIGAYQVATASGDKITFVDTPGHEVFTEMRARGAKVTDIVVLVVAADDGVQPQTREAVSHAEAAEVPIVVAVNKIDLPDVNLDNINQQLVSMGLQSEQWGGQTLVVPVSAITGEGIDKLLDAILLTSEVLELKAPLDVDAYGSVIEVRTEKGLGPVVTAIVRAGILRKGQFLLCDTEYGRVRALRDENNQLINEATPSVPVQIQGIAKLPKVGCEFFVVKDESSARDHAEDRRYRLRERDLASKRTVIEATDLDELFALSDAEDKSKSLNLVIKTDVAGSCEAMEQVIAKLGTEDCKPKIIHSGVGAIAESDVLLAEASKALLVGFRVVANPKARRMIADRKIPIIYNDVFYGITDTIKERLQGMLEPEQTVTVKGTAVVKEVFYINKLGKVAGCSVEDGVIASNLPVRIIRDGKVIADKVNLTELRHYKDKVQRINAGSDCGIFMQRFGDCKPGDNIESLEIVNTIPTLTS